MSKSLILIINLDSGMVQQPIHFDLLYDPLYINNSISPQSSGVLYYECRS